MWAFFIAKLLKSVSKTLKILMIGMKVLMMIKNSITQKGKNMKFLLDRASDYKDFGIIEINSLDELKQLNDKYNSKEEWAWSDSHSIVINFSTTKDDQRQGIDGTITIYDSYIE